MSACLPDATYVTFDELAAAGKTSLACRSDSPSKLDRLAILAAEDPRRTPVKITLVATAFDGFAR